MQSQGNPQGNIITQLEDFAKKIKANRGFPPQLIVVVLPEMGNELYAAVKQ